jgi:hypothetical protein
MFLAQVEKAVGDNQGISSMVAWDRLAQQVVTTVIFLFVGLIFFALTDWFVERMLARSMRKAIEEDKNVALAIVVGSGIIGMALIIAAAIRG